MTISGLIKREKKKKNTRVELSYYSSNHCLETLAGHDLFPSRNIPQMPPVYEVAGQKEGQASNKEILRTAYRKQEPGAKRGILGVTIDPMVEILVKQRTKSRLDVTKSAE